VRYRVTDLGIITGGNDTDDVRPFAVNNLRQVVGQYDPLGTDSPPFGSGFIWLPHPAFYLDAGMHDLTALAGLNPTAQANDINDAGIVVGSQEVSGGNNRAFVWDLTLRDSDPLPIEWTLQLGTLYPGSIGNSKGNGINNDDPPIIVGESDWDMGLSCPIGPFRLSYDGTPSMEALPLPSGEPYCRGVANQVGDTVTSPGKVVGAVLGTTNAGSCSPTTDATRWSGVSPIITAVLEDYVKAPSEVFDVNAKGDSVGVALERDVLDCLQRAAYWPASGTALVELGDLFPLNTETDARAIYEDATGVIQVAGANLSTFEALHLGDRQPAGAWVVNEVEDFIDPACTVVLDYNQLRISPKT
jgi:hypothetical protein